MKVGIIGLGVIGTAQADMFHEHEVVTYDPAVDEDYPYEQLADCDFALICVGTPEGDEGRADLRQVKDAAELLPPDLPVCLRSTVPPGTTDELFSGWYRLYCHAPEFMGENVLHSWQRPVDVPYMILGGSPESTLFFRQRFSRVFPGHIATCTARESELAKYAANLYWATRVTFVNELAKVCESFGVDYENVRGAWLSDPRMTSVYTQRAGYPPGFDGRCWPKDLAALIAASSDAGYDPEFLRALEDANERFREATHLGHSDRVDRPPHPDARRITEALRGSVGPGGGGNGVPGQPGGAVRPEVPATLRRIRGRLRFDAR